VSKSNLESIRTDGLPPGVAAPVMHRSNLPNSFIPAISIAPFQVLCYSEKERRSRLQHGYCIGVSRRSPQATAGKGLAQGPYVATRVGIEPTTLQLKVVVSTKAPPRPTTSNLCRSMSGIASGRSQWECRTFHPRTTHSPVNSPPDNSTPDNFPSHYE